MTQSDNGRIVGIRHRVKRTADGESRPTQVAIITPDGSEKVYDLETENDELDWVRGIFPTEFRQPREGDLPKNFPAHFLKWRKVKAEEEISPTTPGSWIRQDGRITEILYRVPSVFDGLKKGDRIAMTLGGSGDYLAYALSARGEKIGAIALRIPPFALKENRPQDKETDALNLAHLLRDKPELFYPTRPVDRPHLRLRIAYRERMEAMKARIATEQRLRRRTIGSIFCAPGGELPSGTIDQIYLERKATDTILNTQEAEEAARDKELAAALAEFWVYTEILADVSGMGPSIASRILASVPDIRLFPTQAKFKAYCGVHVRRGGQYGETATELQFPRKRQGTVANWSGDLRQAMYLFLDQCQYRPNSHWGQELRTYRDHFRKQHPEVVEVAKVNPKTGKPVLRNGEAVTVKRYTDGHILKMARWRTATRFIEWLYDEWTRRAKQRGELSRSDEAAA